MKCELCNSGEREPKQRLCMPCVEAVARLRTIVNSTKEHLFGDAVSAPAAIGTKHTPILPVRPYLGLQL